MRGGRLFTVACVTQFSSRAFYSYFCLVQNHRLLGRIGQLNMCALAASSQMKLIDEDRKSRRTIADAIEIMRLSSSRFPATTRLTIRTQPLRLPSGDVPFLTQVACAELALAVSLPTSKKFRAKRTRTPATLEFDEFETCLLDGAGVEIIDEQLEVVLSDGRRLRGVQVIPCYLPPCVNGQRQMDALRLHKEVIGLVVKMCNAQGRCYKFVDKDLLPGIRVLDFDPLRELQLRPLSEIVNYIHLNHERLNPISGQTVANILRDWGLRIPRPQSVRRKSAEPS